MKKFLSIILTLAMVILPVGAVSCFADEKEFIGNDQYIMLQEIISSLGLAELASEDVNTMEIIADMDQSSYTARACFFAKDGRLLKIQKLREGSFVYEEIKEYIEVNYFTSLDTIGIYKCSKVNLSFFIGTNGHKDIGILTVRAYDEAHYNEITSSITSFYKLFSLKNCPQIIDKLGLWHQLICVYFLFAKSV